MEKFKRSWKNRILLIFFSIFTSVGVVCSCMLPSFAYQINGYDAQPVTITKNDLINMFNNGDLTVNYRVTLLSGSYYIYDMVSHTRTTMSDVGTTFTAPLVNCDIVNNRLFFYKEYAYLLRPSSSIGIEIGLSFPFEYYVDRSTFYGLDMLFSGYLDSSISNRFQLLDSDNNIISSRSYTVSPAADYWYSNTYYNYFESQYNWIPGSGTTFDLDTSTGIKGLKPLNSTSYSLSSNNQLCSSIFFNSTYSTVRDSATGNNANFYGAFAFYWNFPDITVYVEKDKETLILEYLSLIGSDSPTPAQQDAIDDLRDQFSSNKEDMEQWAEDLDAEVPDRPGLDELPTVSVDGQDVPVVDVVNEVSETVISPLFNYSIVTILVGSVLGISFIKILLFGSGDS